jgi:small nuclear ribonucleoprotein (snRNP)-like protein
LFGIFKCIDGCLNAVLENVVDKQLGMLPEVFIRGNNVLYITPVNKLKKEKIT